MPFFRSVSKSQKIRNFPAKYVKFVKNQRKKFPNFPGFSPRFRLYSSQACARIRVFSLSKNHLGTILFLYKLYHILPKKSSSRVSTKHGERGEQNWSLSLVASCLGRKISYSLSVRASIFPLQMFILHFHLSLVFLAYIHLGLHIGAPYDGCGSKLFVKRVGRPI